MKSILIILAITIVSNTFAQKAEWERMFPLNDGDYWVYELLGPGGYLASTETKRVLGDSLEANNKLYKTLRRSSHDFDGQLVIMQNVRIDSIGVIYDKTKWDSVEQFFLPLNVTKGDTIPDPGDPFDDFWIIGDIWYTNGKKNIIYEKRGLVFTSIWMKEDFGYYQGWFESGGNLLLKGSYVKGVLIGDTSIVTSIESEKLIIPKSVQLFQNYPNPFNGTTSISYQLSKPAIITLTIFNSQGMLIKKLINQQYKIGGVHYVKWDGSNLKNQSVSSGLYYYQLTANHNFQIVKKLMFIK